MSKTSKTARASMTSTFGEKKVVPDDVLVKQYREGRAARLWPSLESSDSVLRSYDLLVNAHASMGAQLHDALENNKALREELLKASEVITKLNAEIAAAQEIFSAATVAEAKNNHD